MVQVDIYTIHIRGTLTYYYKPYYLAPVVALQCKSFRSQFDAS